MYLVLFDLLLFKNPHIPLRLDKPVTMELFLYSTQQTFGRTGLKYYQETITDSSWHNRPTLKQQFSHAETKSEPARKYLKGV